MGAVPAMARSDNTTNMFGILQIFLVLIWNIHETTSSKSRPPQDLRVSNCDSSIANLMWDEPNQDEETVGTYHVHVAVSDGQGKLDDALVRVPGWSTEVNIPLGKWQYEWGAAEFTFAVRAEFPDGSTEYSEAANCTTFEPSPENVRMSVCGATGVEITWEKGSDDVIEYVIEDQVWDSSYGNIQKELLRVQGLDSSVFVETR